MLSCSRHPCLKPSAPALNSESCLSGTTQGASPGCLPLHNQEKEEGFKRGLLLTEAWFLMFVLWAPTYNYAPDSPRNLSTQTAFFLRCKSKYIPSFPLSVWSLLSMASQTYSETTLSGGNLFDVVGLVLAHLSHPVRSLLWSPDLCQRRENWSPCGHLIYPIHTFRSDSIRLLTLTVASRIITLKHSFLPSIFLSSRSPCIWFHPYLAGVIVQVHHCCLLTD